jgi:hypothetical protein
MARILERSQGESRTVMFLWISHGACSFYDFYDIDDQLYNDGVFIEVVYNFTEKCISDWEI